MTDAADKSTDTILREALNRLDPHQVHVIRETYYQAVQGLYTLAEALEAADLTDEHLLACQALATMNQSRLGRVL